MLVRETAGIVPSEFQSYFLQDYNSMPVAQKTQADHQQVSILLFTGLQFDASVSTSTGVQFQHVSILLFTGLQFDGTRSLVQPTGD